ncbi:MAG: preprotein translocase subunit SecE [Gemmatimonadales bacterium]
MAGESLAREGRSWPVRVVAFLAEVKAEMRKVTWPTWPELKKATTVIVIFVFALGLAIGWFDVLLQFVLVKLVARLF